MFYLNREIELDGRLLKKMFEKFNLEVQPKLKKYKEYYDGIQAILQKAYSDPTKPCNQTVINYCKNIVDSYCGYIATPGYISYKSNDDIEEVMNVLKYNDYQTEDADFLLDALVYGTAAELMYNDSEGKTRFRLINPQNCFAVYDDSLTGDLTHFVRWYKQNEWDESDDTYIVDVYNDSLVKHYTMRGMDGELTLTSDEPHFFSQCPANIFTLPDEKSIFECILTLQDSMNKLVSAEIDDYEAFVDAYLALTNMDAEVEDIKDMKENRVLLFPEGGKGEYLVKQVNDTQIENILKRIHDSIYRISACVDFSSESFTGGVSSGVAIQFKVTGMETRAGKIEAAMKKALQRRIEIICGIATLKLGEEAFRDVAIEFKRNVPADINATVQLINALKGTVSDKTLLTQLDFINDVDAELEALAEQKQADMSLYNFGNFHSEDEEELE